ncbi:MAG TPA: hypothetical protein VF223_24145 [Trebonia sp.]|jgi:hypothetical protein
MSATAPGRVTVPGLQAMKAAGTKSVCVVAQISFDALTAYAADVRAGRQIRGGIKAGPV